MDGSYKKISRCKKANGFVVIKPFGLTALTDHLVRSKTTEHASS